MITDAAGNTLPGQTPAPESRISWRTIGTIVLEHRRPLIVAHLVAIFAVLVSVPVPLLLPLLVDEVLLKQPGTLVGIMDSLFPAPWHGPVLYVSSILILTIVLRLAFITLNVWQTRQFTLIAKDISYRLRVRMLHKLERISMAEYESLGSGAVSSYFVTDMNAIDEFIGSSLSKTLVALLSLIGVSAILLYMHWQLALFIIFLNPLVIWFTMVLGRRVKNLKRKENSAFEVFQQALTETLDGIQEIRAGGREKHYLDRVAGRAGDIRHHAASFSWKSDAANRFSFGVFLFGFDLFRGIAMLMVVFSNLSVGEMLAVFGYLWFMMTPVQDALNVQYAWYAAKAALSRINGLLGLNQEPVYPHREDPFRGNATTSVTLEDVSFCYRENELVLDNVSLHIEAGEKIALVGASGGGKSTLVQVLLGLYPVTSGSLKFGGVPVQSIGLDVVRRHVATVLQHPAMFNDTVRGNLTLGRDFTDRQLWQALETAQLADIVRELPQGLDTRIGNQGVRLSGGQRQRLAIARLILSDPKIVILDEATSALDTQTEADLHRAMRDFLAGRTTIIIAHRLSAVRQAQRVYVFEDGRIIEQGSHQELARGQGLYSRLYGRQHQQENPDGR